MKDLLFCSSNSTAFAQVLPGVGVSIELGEIAACDVDPDAMTGQKDVCGSDEVDLESVDLVRAQKLHPVESVAKPGAQDSFGDVHCESIRVDIHQLGGKIGVGPIRRSKEAKLHGSSDGDRFAQYLARVDENVVA